MPLRMVIATVQGFVIGAIKGWREAKEKHQ